MINAAIWFGATFFASVILSPAFGSDPMLAILPQSHAGRAMQIVFERFSVLQYWCGGIALAHLLTEWLYSGKPLRPWTLYLVSGAVALAVVGGFWIEPRVKKLHLDVYGVRSTPQQREQSRRSLVVWGDAFGVVQYLMVIGPFLHLLQVTAAGSAPRFPHAAKFKG